MKGKKTGGRVKGSVNKTTAFTKEIITDLLSEYTNSGMMADDFRALEPQDRLEIAVKLTSFVVAKPQSIDMSVTSVKKKTIEDILTDLSEEEAEEATSNNV